MDRCIPFGGFHTDSYRVALDQILAHVASSRLRLPDGSQMALVDPVFHPDLTHERLRCFVFGDVHLFDVPSWNDTQMCFVLNGTPRLLVVKEVHRSGYPTCFVSSDGTTTLLFDSTLSLYIAKRTIHVAYNGQEVSIAAVFGDMDSMYECWMRICPPAWAHLGWGFLMAAQREGTTTTTPVEPIQREVLAICLVKLIATHLRLRSPDDRDSWEHKQIATPGQVLYDTFRRAFDDCFLQQDSNRKNKKWSLQQVVHERFRPDGPNNDPKELLQYMHPIWRAFEKLLSGQNSWTLEHEYSPLKRYHQLLQIHSSIDSRSRSLPSRAVHPSQFGFICPATTPDDENAGLTKSMTVACRVSSFSIVQLPPEANPAGSMVILNGVFQGYFRNEEITIDVQAGNVHVVDDMGVIYIFTNGGRLLRPLLSPTTKHWVWMDALQIAHTRDIDQYELPYGGCIYGVAALSIPFVNHLHGPRVNLAAKFNTQALRQRQLDELKNPEPKFVAYAQQPLVETSLVKLLPTVGTGTNAIVAVMPWDGMNQEDALVFKQEFLHRGAYEYLDKNNESFPAMVGDKFSSRHAQKAVIGAVVPEADLPFGELDGVVPDIIMNPHGLVARQTVGQVFEMVIGKVLSLEGHQQVVVDPFERVPVEEIAGMLLRYGYSSGGSQTLIDGRTGETYEARILMGPCFYQQLKHQVKYKYQVRGSDHRRDPIMGQGLRGRAGGAALRQGNQETGILHCVPSMGYHQALVSDGANFPVCRQCGHITDVPDKCLLCPSQELFQLDAGDYYGEDGAGVRNVFLPRATVAYLNTIRATGIDSSLVVKSTDVTE